jgi:phosphoglycolate phosphatase-like HAD superfamily hydrolase
MFVDVKLFIFDLDRTIADLQVDWKETKRKIRKILKTDHSLTPLIPSIEELVSNADLKKEVYRLIDKEEMKRVKKLKPDEDVVKLFNKLKTSYKIALVTLQGRAPAVEALKKLKLHKHFDLIISRDENTDREQQIRILLEKTDINPNQAIIVADRLNDMLAARKLGCKSIAITEKSDIIGDYKFKNIKEISKALKER